MGNRLSRRQVLKGLAVGGVAAALAGCGGGAPAPTSTTAPSKAAAAPTTAAPPAATKATAPTTAAPGTAGFNWEKFKGAKIRFVNNTHDWSTELIPKVLPDFENLTGIKVNWEVLPENQFRQKLTLELQSNPESVDGYMSLPSWDAKAFAEAKWYEPVQQYADSKDLTNPDYDFKDFFPTCIEIATVYGTLVGAPLYPEVQLLYYNKEKMEQKGVKVPETLDEFVAAAEKMYDKNANVAGYISRGDGIQAVYTISPFYFAVGGRWLDDAGRPHLDEDQFVQALEYYSGTLRKFGPPGIAGQQWSQNVVIFDQGNAAMQTDSSNFVSTHEDPNKSKMVGKTGYAPLPKGPDGLRSSLISWCLAISSKSKNKEAAWYFIQWLTSKEMVAKGAKDWKLPVGRQSVWNSSEYQSLMPKPWLDAFSKTLPTAVPNGANPLVAKVPETRDAIGKAIVAVIQGDDAKEAAAKAQTDLLKVLGL
ncbi:MAG: ABC transporter substrate-binding protein [Chloroflexota bacterium]